VPIALALFLSGTRYIPAAEVALFALLETVIGPILVWLGVGEVPTLATWIGGGFVMTAIIVNSILALRSQ
jgi:drug/metabolite transporter (DMT)-like permease